MLLYWYDVHHPKPKRAKERNSECRFFHLQNLSGQVRKHILKINITSSFTSPSDDMDCPSVNGETPTCSKHTYKLKLYKHQLFADTDVNAIVSTAAA